MHLKDHVMLFISYKLWWNKLIVQFCIIRLSISSSNQLIVFKVFKWAVIGI